MKLTTKRDRWYFRRELFSYMIPMILIVGTIDVFFNFMQCSVHPEWSAPCSVIWINAVMYGFVFIIIVIFAIFSARKLKKIKKRMESEFLRTANHAENKVENVIEVEKKPEEVQDIELEEIKEVALKSDKKEPTKKVAKKEKKKTTKTSNTKESSIKKKTTKK